MISGVTCGSADQPIAWDMHLPTGREPLGFILVLHGFKGFKDWGFFPLLAEELADSGFAAIRMNSSHNGVGQGPDSVDFTRLDLFAQNRASYELADESTMIHAIQNGTIAPDVTAPRDRIGLFGHSRGGPSVLLAADNPAVKAIVTWASVQSTDFSDQHRQEFLENGRIEILNGRTGQTMIVNRTALDDVTPLPPSLDVAERLASLETPLLLVHGENDTSVPLLHSESIREFGLGRPDIEVISGADHVMNCRHPFEGETEAFREAVALTVQHFLTNMM